MRSTGRSLSWSLDATAVEEAARTAAACFPPRHWFYDDLLSVARVAAVEELARSNSLRFAVAHARGRVLNAWAGERQRIMLSLVDELHGEVWRSPATWIARQRDLRVCARCRAPRAPRCRYCATCGPIVKRAAMVARSRSYRARLHKNGATG